ncbi:hypothetical protein ACOT81_18955 [Streptomyces sp. WI04-05B]|uniref:hypothetical protein n=1 Tax=Streptomyces TaxID=1883 RepID=UPI0029B951E2|nr:MULTISPECIES: hypothetical protein [unclassified Streptomyces]MDX2542536.1 hypothetical protein [Streptomyces sp. WI04-05B]MDX2582445.1 hypothetical protein [Streptomyces sp. WI04-05A]
MNETQGADAAPAAGPASDSWPGAPVGDRTVGDRPVGIPRDYRLLVPREWFRIDLTKDRWRAQLKTFVDHQAEGRPVSAELTRNVWTTLRNTAEAGRARGALEFFLLATFQDGSLPMSLLVSSMPLGETPADPRKYAAWLEVRRGPEDRPRDEVSVVDLPAGPAVRVLGATTLNVHVRMPGGVGYLTLSFSAPVTGMVGPMERLCDAIAGSLGWVG